MPSVSDSIQAPTSRARLRGESLRKWYARSGNLTPEQWEAEQKRQEEERRGPARLFLSIALPVLMLLAPLSGPVVTAILGVWLVIGSGNFWWRVALTMGAVFLMGCWSPFFAAVLLWILFLSTSFAYVWSMLFPRFYLMPSRPVQFSLWQIGGCTIILAAAMALLRTAGFNLKVFEDLNSRLVFFLLSPAIVVNVVLASLPILVPARYRTAKLFGLSAILVLIVLPNLEFIVGLAWLGWSDRYVNETVLGLVGSHFAGAIVVWVIVYTMEGALAFCDVKPPTDDTLDVEADPQGTPRTTDEAFEG